VLQATKPPWLDSQALHAQLLGREAATPACRRQAAALYVEHVRAAAHVAHPNGGFWQSVLRQQVFMGDDAFIARMQQHLPPSQLAAADIPKTQRHTPPQAPQVNVQALLAGAAHASQRNSAAWQAHRHHGLSMTAIAAALGLSVSRVSRLIAAEEAKGKT
jgi:DNA-directed RNA polymerase specialized sigma24 family protein